MNLFKYENFGYEKWMVSCWKWNQTRSGS